MLDEVKAEIWPQPRPAFKATTPAEREAVRALLPKMIHAAQAGAAEDAAWSVAARAAGMRVEVWEFGTEKFWALLEDPKQRRGAGAYLIRVGAVGSAPEVVLEAPHVFFDLGTEGIAASIFFAPPEGTRKPRAFFTNTVHRYQDSKDPLQRTYENPADVCHNADHLYNAVTIAAAEAIGRVEVIQLHGYSDEDPEARGGLSRESTMVVSAGVAESATPRSKALAARLKRDLDPGVRLFPEEAHALGATKNVQGIGVRKLAGADFLHLEMSTTLRRELNADPAKLRTFGTILMGVEDATK